MDGLVSFHVELYLSRKERNGVFPYYFLCFLALWESMHRQLSAPVGCLCVGVTLSPDWGPDLRLGKSGGTKPTPGI